jgi:predicted metal-dependent hydrolase
MMKKENQPPRYTIEFDGIGVEVSRKRIRNINLRVHIRRGEVKLSAPVTVSDEEIRRFLIQKTGWIKKHLSKSVPQSVNAPQKYESGDSINVWGREVTLVKKLKKSGRSRIIQEGDRLILELSGNLSAKKRERMIREWYRRELKREIPKIISKYEDIMGVHVSEFGVKKMKTRWGSCNTREKRIWLNLNLAERDPALLEYVTVHEMVHLLERGHNRRFYRYMDTFLPGWREYDRMLKNS